MFIFGRRQQSLTVAIRTELSATIDRKINLTYAIIGSGLADATLARFFAAIEVGRIAEGGGLIQARTSLVFQNLIKYPM